ncbi:MAG TPA: heat-inducible transcriptional repressor HrcA [Bryobacteraceae bacterium]|nr:heat-inducible transcriptional repressor HrcA [Bryobacteraceae bacterium]
MSGSAALTHRQRDVLYAIVETYIATGEPVASRTISKRRKDSLSPASIRNVMADLSDEGYLAQPHTSAGRIPTEKAIRAYVQSLMSSLRPVVEAERLRADLGGADSLTACVERSSRVLTRLTHNVGIAAAIPTATQTLEQIELIKLADKRVLMVVVTRDRIVRDRVVTLPDDISQDDLNSIRNYLNANFSGWPLLQARQEIRRRLEQESAAYDAILAQLGVLYSKGLLDIAGTPEIHMEGAANLVGLDLHLTREKMRELFRTLEEKKRILMLLDRFLEQPRGEIAVQVGLGEAHPAMSTLSLIGLRVGLPGGLAAKIAVLGPIRMNYERVMCAVWQVGQTFEQIAGATSAG